MKDILRPKEAWNLAIYNTTPETGSDFTYWFRDIVAKGVLSQSFTNYVISIDRDDIPEKYLGLYIPDNMSRDFTPACVDYIRSKSWGIRSGDKRRMYIQCFATETTATEPTHITDPYILALLREKDMFIDYFNTTVLDNMMEVAGLYNRGYGNIDMVKLTSNLKSVSLSLKDTITALKIINFNDRTIPKDKDTIFNHIMYICQYINDTSDWNIDKNLVVSW